MAREKLNWISYDGKMLACVYKDDPCVVHLNGVIPNIQLVRTQMIRFLQSITDEANKT